MATKSGISFWSLLFHVFMTLITGGFWLIVLVIWFLLKMIKK